MNWFLGFCKQFNSEKRKKRNLQQSGFYRERHMNKRIKREDRLTEEDILKRSYKARLG
jgi:hypothetical protein